MPDENEMPGRASVSAVCADATLPLGRLVPVGPSSSRPPSASSISDSRPESMAGFGGGSEAGLRALEGRGGGTDRGAVGATEAGLGETGGAFVLTSSRAKDERAVVGGVGSFFFSAPRGVLALLTGGVFSAGFVAAAGVRVGGATGCSLVSFGGA